VGERLSAWFAVVLMSVVLGTSYWYAQSLRAVVETDAGHVGGIDFFAEGIVLTGFDALGHPRYRLFADRMTHYGNSDDIDMVKPRILSMRPDQPQVQASALSAHAQNNGQTVQMRGSVVITRAATPGQEPLRMETEELSAVPDEDHFWADGPVQMFSGRTTLRARGMDMDNVARRIELRSEVVGVFPRRLVP